MSENSGFFDRARRFVDEGVERIGNGGYNWAFALPGMVIGFLAPIYLVNSITGGGFFSTLMGGLIGITTAMVGGVLSTQLTHYVAGQFTDTVAPEQPQPARAPARQRGTERSTGQPRTQVGQVQLEGVEPFDPPVSSADLGKLTPRSTSVASSAAFIEVNIG